MSSANSPIPQASASFSAPIFSGLKAEAMSVLSLNISDPHIRALHIRALHIRDLHLSAFLIASISLLLIAPLAIAEKLPFNGKTLACPKSIVSINPIQYSDAMFKHKVELNLEQTSKLKIESGFRVNRLSIVPMDSLMKSQTSDIRNSAVVVDINSIEVPHPLLGDYVPPQRHWKDETALNSWFYLKKDGKPLSAGRYSYAFDFDNGKGIVDSSKVGDKKTCTLSVIDSSGKDVTATSVPEMKNFCKQYLLWAPFRGGFAPAKNMKSGGYSFINEKFQLAFRGQFDAVCETEPGFYEKLSPVRQDEFWGYIDTKGSMVIKPRFMEALQFHDGHAAVKLYDFEMKQIRRTSPTAQWTFINSTGKKFPEAFDELRKFDGGAGVITSHPVEGRPRQQFINTKGAIFGRTFDEIGDSNEGLIPVSSEGRAGYADMQGKIIIPMSYRAAGTFSEGLAAVVVPTPAGDKIGFIDRTGKLVIQPTFLIDEGYYVILPSDVYRFSEGLAMIKQEGRYGFIDKKGKWIVPAIYSYARPYKGGFAVVKR